MIPIARPILGDEEFEAARQVIASGMLAQGPKVKAFEEAFARDVGRKDGIAVANGTVALHLALLAHGIKSGHEVVIPPLTFFATASTVLMCGGKPVFVDVDRSTYNLDPTKVAKALTAKTAAIMPVHLYGQTADMDPILEAARVRDIPVIEDAAQAHGAEYHGKKAGNLGDTACFSFYATKNMTTGEGGMVVTDDANIAERCRLLRDHGQVSKYEHVLVGYNYRMTEIAAAIGLVQLRNLESWVKQRRANAAALTKGLDGIEGLVPPAEGNRMVHSYYQYVVRREDPFPLSREDIVRILTEEGIGCRPSYPKPLYRQKALQDLRIKGRCPVAEDVVPRLFELPVHPGVGPGDLDRIIEAVERLATPA
ncbi:MAG TPA: DegT/DnrJ/EryC1/StrS family aminotransferase [Thermoplasmata archaeon]|nr:DegT/DnrJ/EryC1/StrS family aminotransferase [Thermoplasmata archaeon]